MTPLKIVSISDLHFGNPRIDATELYDKLTTYYYPQLENAHLITVNGDIYDQLLTVNSKAYAYATQFISYLFRLSERTGCQIRLLHGTFSHDRDQLDIFTSLATPQTRFKIVNHIYSEIITEFSASTGPLSPDTSLRVGYIPDNLSFRSVTDVVRTLQQTMVGYTQLDLLLGHGTFAHTMPAGIPLPPLTYTDTTFTDLVVGIIVMGHIHIHSKHNNIYYCGSFDRMSHNEEEKKGFYSFTYQKGKWNATFHENKAATPFISLILTEPDIEKVSRQYADIIKHTFPSGHRGYVRIIHPDVLVRAALTRMTLTQFPWVIASARAPKDVERKVLKVSDINLDIVHEVKPSKDNLPDLVYQFLQDKNQLGTISKDDITAAVRDILPV